MPIVSIFSGSFCGEEKTSNALRDDTEYSLVTDNDIVKRASALSSIPEERLFRCFSGKLSAFNPFTRDLERSLAWLKLATAEFIQEERLILQGFTSHLIPSAISHVLNVCLIADLPYRIRDCTDFCTIGREGAAHRIASEDSRKSAWVFLLKGEKDPWEPSLYDMVLPTNALGTEKILALIRKGIFANAVAPSGASMNAAATFLEESRLEAALAEKGHAAQVSINGNQAVLTIDRPVLMLERLEEDLSSIVGNVSQKYTVSINVSPEPGNSEIYRKYSHETPSRVLLVDDEREFVQTLSERLEMRDIGSAVAYDGESALHMVAEDDPDVMLLDLQMPGINGIEVLQKVKETRPDIEVIILTGHGTQKDRDLCMQLGAFAYLEKPVDIDILSRTLVYANEKINRNKSRSA